MAVRDIFSNYKPTTIDTDVSIAISTDTATGAVPLDGGETTLVTYYLRDGSLMTAAKIQFSVDAAFTLPVDDVADSGNGLLDADTGAAMVFPTAVDASVFHAKIVNIPAVIDSGEPISGQATAYQYMRIVITNPSGVVAGIINSIAKTGPQRFVGA